MEARSSPAPLDLDSILRVASSLFSELNLGLLIYHLEQDDDPYSLKLLYANRAASEYTRADLSQVVGKYIVDAFPGLAGSELPALYTEVIQKQRSRNIGAFEYQGDAMIKKGHYSVKAFPMPSGCVGVVFENISVRKQLEALVRRHKGKQ